MLGRLTLPRFRLREACSHASHCLVTIAYDYMSLKGFSQSCNCVDKSENLESANCQIETRGYI